MSAVIKSFISASLLGMLLVTAGTSGSALAALPGIHATSTPGPTAPGIGAATGTDAQQSQQVLSTSKSLRSAMAGYGFCGLSAISFAYIVNTPGSSPATFRPGVSAAATRPCPNVSAAANDSDTASAITGMWAWGNPVPAAHDARGLGEQEFAPATIARFASARALSDVRLSVPWEANDGSAITGWLRDSVAAIHANEQTVSALGGENEWVADPSLLVKWMTDARAAAPFDAVQLDLEPWTSDANWASDPVAIASYLALVQTAQSSAHALGMTLNLDVPWWLATTPYLTGTVLEALLPSVDGVAVVAYSDHAGGSDGIIAQAWSAVTQVTVAKLPFTIGVQTSSNEISGGAQYTFADKGSIALEAECAKVRAAYSTVAGYSGVTIEEYLSWAALQP